MIDEKPISRAFVALVPIIQSVEDAKVAARKKIYNLVKSLPNKMIDKKHYYKIVQEEFEKLEHNGQRCLQVAAFVESDAFTPSKFNDWLKDKGGTQDNFDSFMKHYMDIFPEWKQQLH